MVLASRKKNSPVHRSSKLEKNIGVPFKIWSKIMWGQKWNILEMFKLRRFIIEYGSEKNFQSAPETIVGCKTKEEIDKKNFIIFLFSLLFFVKHKCPYMIK